MSAALELGVPDIVDSKNIPTADSLVKSGNLVALEDPLSRWDACARFVLQLRGFWYD
jgi:hypothetical protein